MGQDLIIENTADTPQQPAADSALPSAPRYDRRIVLALRKIMQSMDTQSRRLIKQHDITIPQLVCLYELYEKGATTVAVLARNIHVSASTVVGIVDRLEEKQFVTRARNSVDRRTVFVNITDKGREFIATSPTLMHNRLHESLNTLSEQEQIIIANSLDMLVHLMQDKQP